jgi:predicted lipoprotein
MGTQTIIGDTMYMHMQGRTMKLPMPKGTLTQWRDPANLAKSEEGMTVQARGTDTIDGASARGYLVHHEQPQPTDVTMWINGDGLPVRIQVASMMQGKTVTSTINYSRFNDPTIRVDAE